MTIADGKERRYITLPIEFWEHLDEKLKQSKIDNRWGYGRQTTSTEIEKLVNTDIQLKKAGFTT